MGHTSIPHSLPVLALSQWHAGGAARQQFIAQLGQAARDIGFFYLTEHGIERQQQQHILALAKQFFALPPAEKQAIAMVKSPHFRGYTGVQQERTGGTPDLREQFDYMAEQQAIAHAEQTAPWQAIIGPNQWPQALPQLRSELLAWQQQLSDISLQLLEAFALALQLPADAFADTVADGPYTHTKLIRYPQRASAEQTQGVGAHKDPGYLTLVLQDTQSGLEVATDDGWLAVAPLDGAFVVNIGELLELASNGYLRATTHRVVSPAEASERLSCAFFMAAQLSAEVPLLALPEHLQQLARGPASDPANPLFRQVGENVLKGRLRSHPDVAAAHYR